MIGIQRRHSFFFAATLFFVGVGMVFFYFFHSDSAPKTVKTVSLWDDGLWFTFQNVEEETVEDFLNAHALSLKERESVFPFPQATLFSGMSIYVERTHPILVRVDGKETTHMVGVSSVGEALMEAGVLLDEDDMVYPERESFSFRNQSILVTRVDIREEVVEKSVAFEKKSNEDDELSWRKTVVTQKGEKGIDRLVYRVSTHDGKEVNRKLIRTERVKEPVTEIVTQGTYVKLGKSHAGAASWYAWTGTMAAANPWLPKGSYVKVTNTENGKSVIVVINDRGPFVPGRIIDLDKVAFAKIASPGAGVINVKMEEIVN